MQSVDVAIVGGGMVGLAVAGGVADILGQRVKETDPRYQSRFFWFG